MKRFIALFGALLMSTNIAHAAEKDVTISVGDRSIVGTLAVADDKIDKNTVFLLLHGFTGQRHELPVKDTELGVFSLTAQLLENKGYSSLRIDFAGSGESTDLKWEDTTFSSQIRDAKAAIEYLKSNEATKGKKIIVLGWSQGGLVASHAVAGRDDVAGAILWAPVASPQRVFSNLLGAETVKKAIAGDAVTVHEATLPWGAKTSLKGAFFKELATHAPVAAMANYGGPLQVIVGSKDNVVTPSPQVGERYVRYHTAYDELHVLDTDHVFDAFVGKDTLVKMNDLVVKFAQEQVK